LDFGANVIDSAKLANKIPCKYELKTGKKWNVALNALKIVPAKCKRELYLIHLHAIL